MNAVDLLYILEDIDPVYLKSAEFAVKKSAFRGKWRVLAACFCLIFVGGLLSIGGLISNKNNQTNKIKINSLNEISDNYNGKLLAENLDLSENYSPSIELKFSENGGLNDPSSWEFLSVSAEYPDCEVVLNCSFEGARDNENLSESADFAEFGGVSATIYNENPEPGFKYVRRAVFEYGGANYELLARSNDENRIYGLLERLLGEENFGKFSEILGFKNCTVRVEETAPHFFVWRFYTKINGKTRQIAEMFGRFDIDMPEAYSADLDGDGTDELICNCVSGDGWQTVAVFRNCGGVIERGCVSQAFYDGLGAVNFGSGSFSERYDPERGFVIEYCTETPGAGEPERKTAAFVGMENLTFYGYEAGE